MSLLLHLLLFALPHVSFSTFLFFFFNDTATTEIYTLSLHDALPISTEDEDPQKMAAARAGGRAWPRCWSREVCLPHSAGRSDRKSTRLNSSHPSISYAVFCLKKKKKKKQIYNTQHVYLQ